MPVIPMRPEPPLDPDEFPDGETYTEALVERFIDRYTKPGDLVFDPFTGSGTTLVVAERMHRRALGLEIDPDRVDIIRRRLTDPTAIRHDDTLRIADLDLPPADLVMTSPPYMTATGHPENPLTGYRTMDGDYRRYIAQLRDVFGHIGTLLAPGGTIVINAANLRIDGRFTPLAWDLARALTTVLEFDHEITIDWDPPIEWMTGDYCLIFHR